VLLAPAATRRAITAARNFRRRAHFRQGHFRKLPP
jgi:hypothetical protein